MLVRTRPLLLVAALLAGALPVLAGPASADSPPVPLSGTGFVDLVADERHGQLFLSSGSSGTGVRVTDLQGGAGRTIDGLAGAHGMALTPDGSSLWVALPSAGALKEVDTTTLAVTQTIGLPTGHCPGDVAVVGTRLVYGHSCNTYGGSGSYGGLGVVDAATGRAYGGVTSGPFYRPVVATGPAGQVYAADSGLSPTGLHLYDVTAAEPVLVAARSQVCSNLRDLSAAPDGSRVVTACGSPYQHSIWSSNKLELMGTYPSGPYPLAGAWSADGETFVAGLDSSYEPDVYVYRQGLNAPARIVDFGANALLRPRGLAVSADGLRVWAVTGDVYGGGLAVRVLDVPSSDTATVTLSASPSAMYPGSSTTVRGRLATVAGAPLADQVLHVTRVATGGSPVTLPDVTTDAFGSFSLVDTPPASGTYVYEVSRDADAARASTSVLVWPVEGTLLLSLARGTSGGTPVSGTAQLYYSGTDSTAGLTVSLVRTGMGMRVELPAVVTDARGRATFSDAAPAGDFTYTATVAANGIHPAVTATASTTVLTATKLTAVAADTVAAGTPVTVSGVLVEPSGPVAGGTVTVSRSGCGTAWSASIATSPDGRYAVTDGAPPVGTCTYRASYAGGSGYASSTASATTTVTLVPTTLGVETPAPTVAGSPVVVRGALTGGGSPVTGATVSVTRAGCSTTGWQASAVTNANGSWSVTDPAAPAGTCNYGVSYAGSSTRAAATSSASVAVALRTTDLTLSVVRGTGSNKKYAYVTAQLGAWHTGKTLRITAQPTGGAEVQLALGTVDSTGRLTATYQPKTTTTYRVTYAGDDWYAPAKAERLQ